jgi:hypothetical protein
MGEAYASTLEIPAQFWLMKTAVESPAACSLASRHPAKELQAAVISLIAPDALE